MVLKQKTSMKYGWTFCNVIISLLYVHLEVLLATELFATMGTGNPVAGLNVLSMISHAVIVQVAFGSEHCSTSVAYVVFVPFNCHLDQDLRVSLKAKSN